MTRKRSRLWRALAVSALFCAFVAPARADLQTGLDAYERDDYAATLGEIGPLAKRGNPHAQYLLGVMLVEGRGVAKDPVMALAWLTCATAKREGEGGEALSPAQLVDPAQKQAITVHKQAIQLRDSLTKQLPKKLADKARRIAKGCKTVAAAAEIKTTKEEQELRSFYRFGFLERFFYFAGDTIMIGLMVIAGQTGLAGLQEFLNSLVDIFGNVLLGLISMIWWFFAARICFIIGNLIRRNTYEKVLKETGGSGAIDDDEQRRRSQLL